MFGNKGLRWKMAAALATIALLGLYCDRRGQSLNPSVWRCLAQPERFKDQTLWVPAARIIATDPIGHTILLDDVEIWVKGTAPAPIGSRAAYVAIFRAPGRYLEPIRAHVLPDGGARRTLMEIVSVLVVLVVLVNFGRHFVFRPKVLQVHGEAP